MKDRLKYKHSKSSTIEISLTNKWINQYSEIIRHKQIIELSSIVQTNLVSFYKNVYNN